MKTRPPVQPGGRVLSFQFKPTHLLKSVEGYVRKATQPCAFAYASARIRRLVRLGVGFYRLAVAEKQRSGLAIRLHTDATTPNPDCSFVFLHFA
jgi:hypothetical protein